MTDEIRNAAAKIEATQTGPGTWQYHAKETGEIVAITTSDLVVLAAHLERDPASGYSLWCAEGHGEARPAVCYRVYEAPDGCDEGFVGEYATCEQAVLVAEQERTGTPRADWNMHRAANDDVDTPDGGIEDDEPISWHGENGWHCVVRVSYK